MQKFGGTTAGPGGTTATAELFGQFCSVAVPRAQQLCQAPALPPSLAVLPLMRVRSMLVTPGLAAVPGAVLPPGRVAVPLVRVC